MDRESTEENFKLEKEINNLNLALQGLREENNHLLKELKTAMIKQKEESPLINQEANESLSLFQDDIPGTRNIRNARIPSRTPPMLKKVSSKEELYSNSSILIARNKQLRDKIEEVIVIVFFNFKEKIY